MLRKLRIRNFKGWIDTETIQMAPITLFFGTNSSGKSSIGQFLMMLRQTVDSPDRKAVFYPGGKTSAVQLGSYQEMVYQRNSTTKISFEYLWDLPETLKIKDSLSGDIFSGQQIQFEAQVGMGEEGNHSLMLYCLKYLLFNNKTEVFSIGMERESASKASYKVIHENYSLKRRIGRVWPAGAPVRFYGFPDEVVAYYQNAGFVKELNLKHENLFHSLFYLGPLRSSADRLYTWSGIEPESVGYSGENMVAALLAAKNRKISLGKRKSRRSFDQIIAEKLKEMGLIEKFNVKQISDQRQEYEVKVSTKNSETMVDLPDVGFGICQVLPVLVQCFYAPARSIIIMEQPDIHLHPSAQAGLADVIIDAIGARENGMDKNIQFIIESHSEHFLRRLQRRIAENKISEEKVSAYFAGITKSHAVLEPLDIDMFGNIRNWPENFFGDEMGDITAQSRAALQKKMNQTTKGEESEHE